MWPFRRKAGKHELGAAVTAIPSVVPQVRTPVYDAPPAAPVEQPAPAAAEVVPSVEAVPAAPVVEAAPPPAADADVAPSVEAAPAPAVPDQAPRVELGFRDGSTAALAPGSDQARALTEIASVLTQRD